MAELKPTLSSRKRVSPIWIIPIVALVLGIWMVIHTFMTEGPEIQIRFNTADGVEAGKTKVKLRNVDIGLVENVSLSEDMEGVVVTIKLQRETVPLLRDDTLFWVVRPRIGSAGISGLGTLVSGAYIELAPGTGDRGRRDFIGLEAPPLTPVGAPGLRLILLSERAASVSTGDAVLYNGYKVGRIESMSLDQESQKIRYTIFIDAPFHTLVNSSVRFWDTSGISASASAEGFNVSTGSLETLLLGGVAFDKPTDLLPGSEVPDETEFKLYSSYDSILENPYEHGLYYVVSFGQSLRGLTAGAPVEYRGITIGRVVRLMIKEKATQVLGSKTYGATIPVLIYLEPGRLEIGDNLDAVELLRSNIERAVENGLRATLQTGNLITGKLYVALDQYPNEAPASLGKFNEYMEIPTLPSGLGRFEEKIVALLDKLEALPLEKTVLTANNTLHQLETTLASTQKSVEALHMILDTEGAKRLPAELSITLPELRGALSGLSPDSPMYQNLNSTMLELNNTLHNLESITRTLSDKPNALVFPEAVQKDPLPKARRQ